MFFGEAADSLFSVLERTVFGAAWGDEVACVRACNKGWI